MTSCYLKNASIKNDIGYMVLYLYFKGTNNKKGNKQINNLPRQIRMKTLWC